MERLLDKIPLRIWHLLGLGALALLTWGSIWISLHFKVWFLLALPFGAIVLLQVIYNYKPLYFLLIFSIPCSLHYEMGDIAIDVVSEPLMLLFLLIFIINTVAGKQFNLKGKLYPFHVLVFMILFWTAFTTITSEFPLRSLKFLLSKIWYIAAFVYIGEKILEGPQSIKKIFWAFFVPLVLVSIGITIRHSLVGFSFEESNLVPYPIFANGVVYAATLVLFLPWCWYARTWYTPKSVEWYLIISGMVLLGFATIITFKRGAWVAVCVLPFIDIAIKRRIFDKMIYAFLIIAAVLLTWLINDNKFYEFAPNYQKTVWHEGDISGHLAATFTGTEISSMERFYRWVAAKNMIADMPMLGSGPSTFNQVYKRYTDDAFRTYVSDNPEQSTTHNYFLLTFSEQGIPGGLLFIAFCIYMLIQAAHLYPRLPTPEMRSILMLALLSLCTILFHSLLNELIEVDKIGAMFWLNMLIIHKLYVWHEPKSLG